MYEFTHKGAWFRWEALDATDRRLVAVSLLTSIPAGFVIGAVSALHAYRAAYFIGSGGKAVPATHAEQLLAELAPAPEVLAAAILGSLACALVSVFAWWRFSLRQDEMFNRIQNHALGCASAWTLAAAAIWWFLERAGLAPPLPLGVWLLLAYVLIGLFWFRAVRRWA